VPAKPVKTGAGRQKLGRGERIRTSGLYVPNVALYQAKLHPAEALDLAKADLRWFCLSGASLQQISC
jgi:hypothetical protein